MINSDMKTHTCRGSQGCVRGLYGGLRAASVKLRLAGWPASGSPAPSALHPALEAWRRKRCRGQQGSCSTGSGLADGEVDDLAGEVLLGPAAGEARCCWDWRGG